MQDENLMCSKNAVGWNYNLLTDTILKNMKDNMQKTIQTIDNVNRFEYNKNREHVY